MKIEEVDRPAAISSSVADPELITAFLNTLETGKAVRVSLPELGIKYRALVSRLQTAAKTHKVKHHTRKEGDSVIIWAEKPAEKQVEE